MKRLSQKDFEAELVLAKAHNTFIERKMKIKAEKNKYKRKLKLPSTSKLVLFGMILICIEIVAFVEYATVTLGDTNALYALVSVPVALAPTIWSYYSKSKAENTKGGIVYETALMEHENNDESNEEVAG